MFNDTTLGDKNYINDLKKSVKNDNFIMTKPNIEPLQLWHTKGHYPILSKQGHTKYKKRYKTLKVSPVQCCYNLKEAPANKILKDKNIKCAIWGIKASDSMRRKFLYVDKGMLFKPKKYKWQQCYPLMHWTDEDIKIYIRKHIKDYKINSNYENGCLCCGTDIKFYPNTLKRLYDSNYNKWLHYMKNGFGEQILIANNINPNKLDLIIKENEKILLQVID